MTRARRSPPRQSFMPRTVGTDNATVDPEIVACGKLQPAELAPSQAINVALAVARANRWSVVRTRQSKRSPSSTYKASLTRSDFLRR